MLTPPALDDGRVLYAAPSRQIRGLLFGLSALIVVVGLMLTVLVAIAMVLISATAYAEGGALHSLWPVVILSAVFGLPLLLVLALTATMVVLVHRTAFVVTTKGVTLSPFPRRRRHVPWEDVAEIGAAEHGRWRGAVVVVRRDGERIVDNTTAIGSAMPHGAAPPHLPPGSEAMSVPQAAVRDAFERHLRGEFVSGGPPEAGSHPSHPVPAPPPGYADDLPPSDSASRP